MRGQDRGWFAATSTCALLALSAGTVSLVAPVMTFSHTARAEGRVIVLPRLRGSALPARQQGAGAAAGRQSQARATDDRKSKAADRTDKPDKRVELAARSDGTERGVITSLPRLRNDTVSLTKPVEVTAPERKPARKPVQKQAAAGAEGRASESARADKGALTGRITALPRLRSQVAAATAGPRVDKRADDDRRAGSATPDQKKRGKKQVAGRATPTRPQSHLGAAPPRYRGSGSDRGALEGRDGDKSAKKSDKEKADPRKAFLAINRRAEHAALERSVRSRMSDAWSRSKRPFRMTSMLSFGSSSAGAGESALRKFRAAVRRYRRDPKNRRITVLQLGDSHTAGDHLSGMMRELLQRRYGSAGRAMLAAGRPYGYYRPYQVHVTQSKGWKVFRSRRDGRRAPIGITGYAVRSSDSEDVIVMQTKGYRTFRRVEIEFMKGPRAGDIVIKAGRQTHTIRTRSRRWVQDRAVLVLPRQEARLEISPKGNGSVYLLSTSLYRQSVGGVAYISHGISGETAKVIDFWNRNIVRWQLQWLKPDLIVLAYGTNEGFDHKLDLEAYARNYRRRLRFLKWAAPSASIVVLGAPDAARLPSWCARGAKRESYSCQALSSSHADNYSRLIATRSKDLCYWHAPPNLSKVRDIQRRIARREGAYFYDWSRVMGGRCGMHKWAKASPALAFSDRVHMRAAGYDISAASLLRALLPDFRPRY